MRISKLVVGALLVGALALVGCGGDDDDGGGGGGSCVSACEKMLGCLGLDASGCAADCEADGAPAGCASCINGATCEEMLTQGACSSECDDGEE